MAVTFTTEEEKAFIGLCRPGRDSALYKIYHGMLEHEGLRNKGRYELACAVTTGEYTVVKTALERIMEEIDELNSKLVNPSTGYSKEIKAQIRALERAKNYIFEEKELEGK